MFHDTNLPDLSPGERRELFVAMTTTLARLYSINWRGCGLEQYGGRGDRGDYGSRQVLTFSSALKIFDHPLHFEVNSLKFSLDFKILQVSVWANNYEMASREAEGHSEMRELGDWLKGNSPPANNQPLCMCCILSVFMMMLFFF